MIKPTEKFESGLLVEQARSVRSTEEIEQTPLLSFFLEYSFQRIKGTLKTFQINPLRRIPDSENPVRETPLNAVQHKQTHLTRSDYSGYSLHVTEKNVSRDWRPVRSCGRKPQPQVCGFFIRASFNGGSSEGAQAPQVNASHGPCTPTRSSSHHPQLALSAVVLEIRPFARPIMSTQAIGVPAPVFQLPTAAAQPVIQTRRAGRLPGAVASIATARRTRANHNYNAQRTAVPAFVNHNVVQDAFQYMERNTIGAQHTVSGPGDVAAYLRARIGTRDYEAFTVLFMDVKNRILACEEMGRGTIDKCPVFPREIARLGLQLNACKVIISHNHPSGSLNPSDADYKLTDTLEKALDLLDIAVLDHIIVSHTGAYSIKGGHCV